MNVLSKEKKVSIIKSLNEGMSIRSAERLYGVHRDTIMRLMQRTGVLCENLLHMRMRNFKCKAIQIDECYGYIGKKERHITREERRANPELGDQYVFTAICAETRLIPLYVVGKRGLDAVQELMRRLSNVLYGNDRIQITTDGYKHFALAIKTHLGAFVDYAQHIKIFADDTKPGYRRGHYLPPEVRRVKEVLSRMIFGNPNPEQVSTSYVERQHLTMRMSMRRFTRLTNAYSKRLKNYKAALAVYFAIYNFCRVHGSLGKTPAMAAGLTDHVWSVEALITQ